MSPALCYRILDHLRELGLLDEDSIILDPMAGIGTTGVCASAKGYKFIAIELEPKFVNLMKETKEYAEKKLFKKFDWEIIQGDARDLVQLLLDKELITLQSPSSVDNRTNGNARNFKAITSPPYSEMKQGLATRESAERLAAEMEKRNPKYGKRTTPGRLRHLQKEQSGYSTDPTNIGNLPDKSMVTVTSPPYGEIGIGNYKGTRDEFVAWIKNELATKGYIEFRGKRYTEQEWRSLNYGRLDGRVMVGSPKMGTEGYNPENPKNIGNLPDNKGVVTITSPPYGIEQTSGGLNTKPARTENDQSGRNPDSPSQRGAKEGYGRTEGQIGKMKDKPLIAITSPPYGEALSGGGIAKYGHYSDPNLVNRIYSSENANPDDKVKIKKEERAKINRPGVFTNERNISAKGCFKGDYSKNPENIGNLSDKPLATITSPPYGAAYKAKGSPGGILDKNRKDLQKSVYTQGMQGQSEGQIAKEEGETYLSAMAKVYAELAIVSDILAIVIKNPTRNGKLRRLDLDTLKILEITGWKLHCKHRALLFEEYEQTSLFGEKQKKVKGRLSFFKRLAWRNGAPVARWEDVLICVRK